MQLFHKAVNRRGTHSTKWDTYKNEELIHAWIADMDFEVPQPIQTALKATYRASYFRLYTSSRKYWRYYL